MEYKNLQALLAEVNYAQIWRQVFITQANTASIAHEGQTWHAQLVAFTGALIDNRSAG
jgi:hypothetical protein